ncbi:MAG: FTR1 family protein [Bacteroidia bacterium]|nr:FTR1 family protein [Bacteroidia bacterium]MDW8235536.1 FTR1 family protein [Bacteroidia bacterium]
MSEAFVTFREGLEAALIVGILARYAAPDQRTYIGFGVLSAILSSILAAILLRHLAAAHELWEIAISLFAAILLVSMVVWMKRKGAMLSQELRQTAQTTEGWMLFGMSFLAVAREGIETVLFLQALWQIHGGLSWAGGFLGMLVAAALGLALFLYGRKIPLSTFFQITSIFLLMIAAGMVAYAIHETLELLEPRYAWAEELAESYAWKLFPPFTQPPTDYTWTYAFHDGKYYPLLHHKGWIGALLHALTGWRASMTWSEVGMWIGTFVVGLWLWMRPSAKKH